MNPGSHADCTRTLVNRPYHAELGESALLRQGREFAWVSICWLEMVSETDNCHEGTGAGISCTTLHCSAIGFRLDSILKLTDTRATNNKMTLMHYLCKHEKIPLTKSCYIQIQLKSLAEEMQAIVKGLEKVELELNASEKDGPVSEIFRKVWHPSNHHRFIFLTLKEFVVIAGADVQSLTALYKEVVGCQLMIIDAVISTLLNFVLMFRRAHQENCKQAELEKKKAEKERGMEKSKASTPSRKNVGA
ncbi:hypothetical protein B296_00049360 [Ensete ventricosum]|uniref:FH2 domain-containing protein n=1 Tax=Ensete ventricosum TaxID=4639 RepID=A0A426YDJ9_ENSVE|nr:hypothetical protein B296_00049360 [Ensete ventricosum]